MDLLMLDEQTTPNDSLDCFRPAEAGGTPGGVDGLISPDDMMGDSTTMKKVSRCAGWSGRVVESPSLQVG